MVAVSVQTGPVAADDSPRDVPKEKWFNLLLTRRSAVHVRIPYDCRSLLRYVQEAEEFRMWEQTGHADLQSLIRDGLKIDPELLEWAKLGLAAFEEGTPVPLQAAIDAGKKSRKEQAEQTRQAVEIALTANPTATQEQIAERVGVTQGRVSQVISEVLANSTPKLLNHGGNRESQDYNCKLEYGNGKDYILARLKRDGHQELAEQVRKGEISARAAGMQAGFVKETPPLVILKRTWKKASPEEQHQFLEWMSNEC